MLGGQKTAIFHKIYGIIVFVRTSQIESLEEQTMLKIHLDKLSIMMVSNLKSTIMKW